MEFTDLIKVRESIRSYDPSRPVPDEVLNRILEAGRIAPSAANRQPWKFLLVSSQGMLERVKACYGREWFHDAPHILILVGLKDQAWTRGFDGYNSVETDAAIAMTHIILAAENEGVGACWIANYDPVILSDALKDSVGHESGQEIFGITPLGYPRSGFSKSGIKKRKDFDEVVEFI